MGKASRRKKLQRALGKERGTKIGTAKELIDDIEKFQRHCTKQVREKARLTILAEPDPVVKDGVRCDTCTATKGCCYQSVYVDLYEALPIARRLTQKGQDTPELRERLLCRGEEMESVPRDKWLDRMEPCVFLTDDEKCSVYAYRPMPCRSYLVFSDPSHCSTPSSQDTSAVDARFLVPEQARMTAGVHQALGLPEIEERAYICSLPRAVWLILSFWGLDSFVDKVNEQPWPSLKGISQWMDGDNPYGNAR